MKNNLFLFVCLLFVSCSDTFESPKAERDGFIQLTETLSGYVKDSTNDLFAYAYSFNDNSFDEVIANDVIASNAPHFENEISSKFLTRSGLRELYTIVTDRESDASFGRNTANE